jgi:hypothetical protein
MKALFQDIYPFRSIKNKQQFDLIFHVRYQHIPTSSPMIRANIKPMWFIDCTTCLLAKPPCSLIETMSFFFVQDNSMIVGWILLFMFLKNIGYKNNRPWFGTVFVQYYTLCFLCH